MFYQQTPTAPFSRNKKKMLFFLRFVSPFAIKDIDANTAHVQLTIGKSLS